MTDAGIWTGFGVGLYGVMTVGAVWAARRGMGTVPSSGWAMVAGVLGIIALWVLPAGLAASGFPFGYLALFAVSLAIFGSLFAKRVWILTRRFGFTGLSSMLGGYYASNGIRLFARVVTLGAGILLLAVAFKEFGDFGAAAFGDDEGRLGQLVSFIIGALILVQLAAGGQGGLGRLAIGQCVVVCGAVFVMGDMALDGVGGWRALGDEIFQLASGGPWPGTGGRGGGDFSAFLAVPGIFQDIAGKGVQPPQGSLWTGLMILTMQAAAIGIALTPLGFHWMTAERRPVRSARQLIVMMAFAAGGMLIIFAAAGGVGSAIGALPPMWQLFLGAPDSGLPAWSVALLAFALIVALHAFTAHMVHASSALFVPPLREDGSEYPGPRMVAAVGVVTTAVVLSMLPLSLLLAFAGIGLAASVQFLPALAGVCWLPWLTPRGVLAGVVAGTLAVFATDTTGIAAQMFLFEKPVWGAFPYTMHSAGWGLCVNILTLAAVSALTQSDVGRAQAATYHDVLAEHAAIPEPARGLIPAAWIFTVAWLLFATGPGTVVGNDIFGRPGDGAEGWQFAIPSIWAWQIMSWGLGVLLVWFLASRLGLAEKPEGTVVPLPPPVAEGIGEPSVGNGI